MSTPASKLPSVTDPIGAISTPPSRLPSGPLGLRTGIPHRWHTSPGVISFIAFTQRTVATAAVSEDRRGDSATVRRSLVVPGRRDGARR
jgi:hypothetical protein